MLGTSPHVCCVPRVPPAAGATYPADRVAEQYALASDEGATQSTASIEGEQPGPNTHRRLLSATRPAFLAMSSGIVGLGY